MSEAKNITPTVSSTEVLGHPRGDVRNLKIKNYDFKRPDKFSKEQIRTLAIVHETFSRLSTASLSAQLRCFANLRVTSVDQLTYEEFIRSVPNPTTLGIIRMHPLKGTALLEIDPSITYAIIDRLLGGRTDNSIMNRDHSEIEISLMDGIMERMMGNLREAWSTVTDLQPELGQIETNPQFAQMVPPTEMAVLITMSASVGDATGMINLCVPYITIEPLTSKLSMQYMYSTVRRRVGKRETPAGFCTNLPVDIDLCTDTEQISIADLGNLTKGMMIPLDAWDSGDAYLRAGDVRTRCIRQSENRSAKPTFSIPGSHITQTERNVFAKQRADNPNDRIDGQAVNSTSDPISMIRDELQQGFAKLTKRFEELGDRQDELSDQVLLTGPPQSTHNAPKNLDSPAPVSEPFDFLRATDGETLLIYLKDEHPQLIALVLSNIDPQLGSFVLQSLPADMQIEVTERIYNIARVSPQVIDRVKSILERKFSALTEAETVMTGGYQKAVEILNLVSRSTEKHIIESLDKRAPELSEDIKQHMFVFEDIVLLDGSAILAVTQTASREDLLTALKGVLDVVYQGVMTHVDTETREFIEKELPQLKPLRLSEVEAAQQRIVETIRQLESEGVIRVARSGEDEFVG